MNSPSTCTTVYHFPRILFFFNTLYLRIIIKVDIFEIGILDIYVNVVI